jgi:hypothetical protein
MTQLNQTCECCRRSILRREVAALASSQNRTRVWCFDCWDNDPEAVEQYRAVPFPALMEIRNERV